MTRSRAMLVVGSLWLGISILVFAMSLHLFPPLDGDALVYFPISVIYKGGHGLKAYFHNFPPDPENRWVYHGFFNQICQAALLSEPSIPALRRILATEIILCLLACVFVFFRIITFGRQEGEQIPASQILLFCLSLTTVSTFLVGAGGRPEPFAMMLFMCGIAITSLISLPWQPCIIAIFNGLLVASHPLVGIMAAFCVLMYFSFHQSVAELSLSLAKFVGCSVGTFFASFLVFPYPMADWFEGMRKASAFALHNEHHPKTLSVLLGYIKQYYFLGIGGTGYGLVFLTALFAMTYFLWSRRSQIGSPLFLLAGTGAFFGLALKTSILIPQRCFNVAAFVPVAAAGILLFSRHAPDILSSMGNRIWNCLASLVLLWGSAGFFFISLMFPFFLQNGLPYAEARADLVNIRKEYSGTMTLSPALIFLCEDYPDITYWVPYNTQPTGFIMVQQSFIPHPDRLRPPEISGMKMVRNRFCDVQPRLFGIKIANTCWGYNYALYIPEKLSSSPPPVATASTPLR